MMRIALTALTVALTFAVAAPAWAAPVTYNQAMTAARDAAKRDRAKWAVPSQTRLKGPQCKRQDALEFHCTYILNGPLKKVNPRGVRRDCRRKVSVTRPDGAAKPVVRRIESACGTVTPSS